MDWVDHDVALKRVYGAWCGYCEVFPEERGAGSLRVVRHLFGNSYYVVGNLQIQYVVRWECGRAMLARISRAASDEFSLQYTALTFHRPPY